MTNIDSAGINPLIVKTKAGATESNSSVEIVKIPASTLMADEVFGFDIYLKKEHRYHTYCKKNEPLTRDVMVKFALEEGVDSENLYIKKTDYPRYQEYLKSQMGAIVSNQNIPLSIRTTALYQNAGTTLNALFDNPESPMLFAQTKELVQSTVSLILSDDKALRSIMEIGSHDYYTYTHSIDVGVFSIGFANHLGFNKNDLVNLAESAMMHDIGKAKISKEIINKQGKLSADEFEEMKMHPVHSYELLQLHGVTNEDMLKGARHHHEKMFGTGYPDKLFSSDIHLFAKIVAISDVFSALTSRRSYKNSMTTFETLTLIKDQMSQELDTALIKEFIRYQLKVSAA